jgi:hypothetical protein
MAVGRPLGSGTLYKTLIMQAASKNEHVAPRHARSCLLLALLTYHIFGEPEPTSGIDDEANAYAVESGTAQMDAVPARWGFIPHALLYIIHAAPGSGIRTGEANVLTTIGITGETFVRDACTLVFPIGAGVTETAVNHIPAMQTGACGQRIVPDKRVEADGSTILVDELEKLLRQLALFRSHWWRWSIGRYARTCRGIIARWKGRRFRRRRCGCGNLAGNLQGWSRRWVLFDTNDAIGSERL